MSRAPGLCRSCGGPKRGRAARTAAPIAQCLGCGNDVCGRHSEWRSTWEDNNDGGYVCRKCIRAKAKGASL